MGYSTEGNIRKFWPDDNETTIYTPSYSGHSIQEILDLARAKWPQASLDDIVISSEKIHTNCITYDLYDGGDYTEFLIITYNK